MDVGSCEVLDGDLMKKYEDLVAVVRCNDCRHFREHRYIPTGVPNFYCNWHEISVEKHDFCSYGERKVQE